MRTVRIYILHRRGSKDRMSAGLRCSRTEQPKVDLDQVKAAVWSSRDSGRLWNVRMLRTDQVPRLCWTLPEIRAGKRAAGKVVQSKTVTCVQLVGQFPRRTWGSHRSIQDNRDPSMDRATGVADCFSSRPCEVPRAGRRSWCPVLSGPRGKGCKDPCSSAWIPIFCPFPSRPHVP